MVQKVQVYYRLNARTHDEHEHSDVRMVHTTDSLLVVRTKEEGTYTYPLASVSFWRSWEEEE